MRFDMKNCEGATVGVRFLPELSIRSVVGTQCAREGLHQFETICRPAWNGVELFFAPPKLIV